MVNLEIFSEEDIKKEKAKYTRKKKYARQELKEKMLWWVRENGISPTQKDFNNNPNYPSYVVYIREFGSWNKAIEAVGLKISQKRDYTREELIQICLGLGTKR